MAVRVTGSTSCVVTVLVRKLAKARTSVAVTVEAGRVLRRIDGLGAMGGRLRFGLWPLPPNPRLPGRIEVVALMTGLRPDPLRQLYSRPFPSGLFFLLFLGPR